MRRVSLIFESFGEATGHEHPHLRAAIANYRQLLAELGLSKKEITAKMREMGIAYETE